MLNPNVQLWLEALRSGKYKKCTDALRYQNQKTGTISYCALGVAMKVAEDHGVKFPKSYWHFSYLPKPVIDWLGLQDKYNHDVKLNSKTVVDLNDGNPDEPKQKYFGIKPMGFKKIADQIEKHPEIFGEVRSQRISKKPSKKGKKQV